MSEWIRHRGSKSMPKCLEGKRFEVRMRDGEVSELSSDTHGIRATYQWNHAGICSDIMAFRILGDINPPDHSKGFPVGTTAKDIGAKVGDEFVVVNSQGGFKNGEVITLIEDDGDDVPYFRNHVGDEHYMNWQELAPIPPKTAIELQAEEVGIPEPVQLVDEAKPDSDGWIEWKGGECPVKAGTLIDVRYRSGRERWNVPAMHMHDTSAGIMLGLNLWNNDGKDYNIIAYRLHRPQEWPEDRMDVIGQNGNDGLHYDAVPTNKYQRTIKGVTVDVYDVLAAFGVTCQARGHAIKKLLMAGQRGHKDEARDLREAVQAIERSIELVGK